MWVRTRALFGTSSASLLRQTPFQCSMQFPLLAGRNRNTFVFCPNIFGVVLFPFSDSVLIDLLSVATWCWRGPLLAPRECASWSSPIALKGLPRGVSRFQPFSRSGRLEYISLAFPPSLHGSLEVHTRQSYRGWTDCFLVFRDCGPHLQCSVCWKFAFPFIQSVYSLFLWGKVNETLEEC